MHVKARHASQVKLSLFKVRFLKYEVYAINNLPNKFEVMFNRAKYLGPSFVKRASPKSLKETYL